MATYIQIATVTVGAGGAASMDFTSIPSTYTDLVVKLSARESTSGGIGQVVYVAFNGSTASFTNKYLQGNGSAASSGSVARFAALDTDTSATANTFGNAEIYIPNYAGNTNKSFSGDAVSETNATAAPCELLANLWSNTAAINQITLTPTGGNFVQYSTATLYGISKS